MATPENAPGAPVNRPDGIAPDGGAPEGTPPGGTVPAGAAGREAGHPRDEQKRLRSLVRALLATALVLVLVRIFVFEPYSIPTGSMRPTIVEGDVLLVSKLPYTIRSIRHIPFTEIPIPYLELPGLGTLERGDVVVFEYPAFAGGLQPDEGSQFVKRCIAIKGDTIQLLEGRVRVNGLEVPGVPEEDEEGPGRRSPIRNSRATPILQGEESVIVPYAGYELQLDSLTAERWRLLIESEGTRVEYSNRIVFLDGIPALRYTFRRDYFFALGDNSRISRDSRFFGFIPYENLIGQAWMIYWSRDPDGEIRWDRIGTIIR